MKKLLLWLLGLTTGTELVPQPGQGRGGGGGLPGVGDPSRGLGHQSKEPIHCLLHIVLVLARALWTTADILILDCLSSAKWGGGLTLGKGPLLRKTGKGSRPSLFSCSSRISTVSSSRK